MVKKRSIVISVILSFLTCGLYGLYWIKGIEVKTEDFALSVAGCALIFTFLNETRQNRKNKE